MKFHVTLRKPDTVYYTCNDGLVKSWWLFVFFKEVFKRKFLSAHELRALIPVSLFSVI